MNQLAWMVVKFRLAMASSTRRLASASGNDMVRGGRKVGGLGCVYEVELSGCVYGFNRVSRLPGKGGGRRRDHGIHAAARATERARVFEVADTQFGAGRPQGIQLFFGTGRADQRSNRFTALRQLLAHRASEQAGGARNENHKSS
jgi:hypothetical protein